MLIVAPAQIGAGAQGRQSIEYSVATLLDNLDKRARTQEICTTVDGSSTQDESRAQALQHCAREVADLSKRFLDHFRKAHEAPASDLKSKSSSWMTFGLEVSKTPCPADTRKVVTP
jgi:hypothetical protein